MYRYSIKRIILAVAASLVVSCGIPLEDEMERDVAGQGQTLDLASAKEFVPMQAIVKFRRGAKDVIATELTDVAALEVLRQETALVHFDAIVSDDKAAQLEATWALIHELRAREDVEYAHPNWLFQLSRVPNDPYYSWQWHFPVIQLPQAWDLTTGSPAIRIAILDTGRTGHPDLVNKWVPDLEYDAAVQDGDATAGASDTWRHGVHVAGIAGGASNSGQPAGTAGVCWTCQLLNVKVSSNNSPDMAAVIRGIYWAVDNGAQVLNMSFEAREQLPCSDASMSGIRDAITYALGRNVSVVAAAGNRGLDAANTVPASCPGVIAVAATDRNNALASYSNRGSVTLAAPGGGGTLITGPNGPVPGPDAYGRGEGCLVDSNSQFSDSELGAFSTWTTSNNGECYRYLSGTSMAAPHVAGVVGLMLSRNPSLTPAQVRQILQSTAQPLPGCGSNCGAGLLNALGAVQAAAPLPVNDAAPMPSFTWQCSGLRCTFDARSSTDDRGIVAYQWILPGQQLRSGVTTTFFMPGYNSQTIRLRVTDTSGQSTEALRWDVTPATRVIEPLPGAYHNPQRPGNNIDLFVTSTGELVLSWYTYEPVPPPFVGGNPVWYNSGVASLYRGRWSAPLYRSTWNGSSANHVQVGTVWLDFSSVAEAWFSWVLNNVAGGERFVYRDGGYGRSGSWYVPSQSGWGINVQESDSSLTATVGFYLHGQPRWMQGMVSPGSDVTIPLTYYKGPGLCPSCGGNTAPMADTDWGASSMNLQIFDDASTTGQASTDIKTGLVNPIWVRPLQTIYLLTSP